MVENRFKILISYTLATGFGVGMVPIAPGTAGAFLAVVLAWLFFPVVWWGQLVMVAMTSLVAIWTAHWLVRVMGENDPKIIVGDEIAGQFLTFLWVPLNGWSLLVGFLLFRIFDIWKPGPIGRAEKLPGGVGVVADDLLAGVAANVLLQIVFRMFV